MNLLCDLESWFLFLRMPYFDVYFSYYWIAKKSILKNLFYFAFDIVGICIWTQKKNGNILGVLVTMLRTNKILLSYFWR